MSSGTLVQARIDPALKKRASAVLERQGMTVSDAVRILLTRTANEGSFPVELIQSTAEHDAWFRAKVQQALDDTRPALSHRRVEAHFAKRRATAARKARG